MATALLTLSFAACGDDDHRAGQADAGAGKSASADAESSDEASEDSTDGARAGQECFVGDWQVDRSSDAWQLPAGDADEVTGTFSVSFADDGSFRMDYERWYLYETVLPTSAAGDSYVETIWDGVLSGDYLVDGDGSATVEITDSSLTLDQVNMLHGQASEDSGVTPIDDEPVPLIYTCDGDRLVGYPVSEPDRSAPWVVYDRAPGN